ncbi:MAG: hypothetical protein LBR71_02135 [Synergistaceae bacterium]|nr:hypothetical protein [Synergistaceae bacterium]
MPVYERQKALSPLPSVRVNAPRADAYGGDVAGVAALAAVVGGILARFL